MIDAYLAHQKERAEQGVPPLPLSPSQTEELCKLLENPPAGQEALLTELITNRVSPGVDPSAAVKAGFLAALAKGEKSSPLISKVRAVELLGTMIGGYNVEPLVSLLDSAELAEKAGDALCQIILVVDMFDAVKAKADAGNAQAVRVIQSWADAEWFTSKPGLPDTIEGIVFKVEGETNTDDLSPASEAWSRPDIPLHAEAMGLNRFPGRLPEIAAAKATGAQVIYVGDVVGTGSSRKSACNSVLWHMGDDIPFVPNKRRGGVILGSAIAPIFYNTAEDSGALPIKCDVNTMNNGDKIIVKPKEGIITDASGNKLCDAPVSEVLAQEVQAGGRVPLIIGKTLTKGLASLSACLLPIFLLIHPNQKTRVKATPWPKKWSVKLAQKKACAPLSIANP